MTNEQKKNAMNEVIKRTNDHNAHCKKVADMWAAEYDEEMGPNQCVETMRQANIEVGIEYCCWMRHYGLPAVVDMMLGYVLPEDEVDTEEEVEEGKKRYLVFEWVEDDKDENG